MRRKLLILTFFLSILSSSFAVTLNVDSVITQKNISGNWKPYAKGHYFWDPACFTSPINLFYDWNTTTTAWDSSSEYLYTYDIEGKTTSATWKYGYGAGMLKNYSYAIYNYTGALVNDITTQYWKPYLSNFRNEYRDLKHYDTNQKLDTLWNQNWDTATTSWKPNGRFVYQNNMNGKIVSEIYQSYNSGSMSYENSYRYDYTYTATNQTDSFAYRLWNAGSSSWPPYQLSIYSYDANDLITSYFTQTYNTGVWSNTSKADYTYNANKQIYQLTNSIWSSGSWLNNYRYTYYYGCEKALGIENVGQDKFQLYPNPVSNLLQINLADIGKSSQFTIINLQGQKVFQQQAEQGTNSISTESLSAGLYILQWINDGQVYCKRFIKE